MNKSISMIWKWLILAILATLSVYVVTTPPGGGQAKSASATDEAEKGFLQKYFPGIRIGIDLAGGTSFTVVIDEARLREDIRDEVLAEHPRWSEAEVNAEVEKVFVSRTRGADTRVLEVLRKRVDGMGVNEPVIFKGKDRIIIQLPGANAEQREMAERSISSAAFLEFRLVHKDNDAKVTDLLANRPPPKGFTKSENGRGYVRAKDYDSIYNHPDAAVRAENLRALSRHGCERIPNHVLMLQESERDDNIFIPVFVSIRRDLTGADLQNASVDTGTYGEIGVSLRFNNKGATTFRQLTSKYKPNGSDNPYPEGRRLAIILDGVLYSAPVIQSEIPNGNASITGRFTAAEAQRLANTLNAGALPTPVMIVEKRVIDPTLGRDAINSGLYAAVGGTIILFIFMLIYYFYLGFLANAALVLDIILLPAGMILAAGCLSFFDSSVDTRLLSLPVFTMPGIAGIVLTIGMATDANILIFERIREEFKLGKSARAAVQAGYDRAFITILDANLTSLITAAILFAFGTGPIKGFAITLTAGLLVSMFTVLVITRVYFDLTVPEGRVKPYKMLSFLKDVPKFDFLGNSKPAIIATAVFLVATLAWFGFQAATSPSSVLAVDMTGGLSVDFGYTKQHPSADVRAALAAAGFRAEIQYQKDFINEGVMQVRTSLQDNDPSGTATIQKIGETLSNSFPDSYILNVSSADIIGSSIGKEMQKSAFWAVTLALIGMVVYIALRFEFGFACGTLAALAVDVFFCLGFFILCGRQINLTAVAAFLTVVGYAINDSIVVFDRIREDLAKDPRTDFKTVINQACNRTLSRTVLTSVTTLLPVGALVIFGSGAIFDFALIMGVGIIFGTFATLFIATPVMVAWYRGRRPGFVSKK